MVNIHLAEGRKSPKWSTHESADGVRLAPGPFIGIVKGNTDPLRSGRLQVWIPELGGDPDDDASWRTVGYSTPFYGVTDQRDSNDFAGSPHSYGMWFVPPDIGVKVMCIFINGDPARGYYFGCIPEWPNLHMLPAISGAVNKSGPDPVTDYYDGGDNASALADVANLQRKSHDIQKQIWSTQGLLQDPDRGPGNSSAFRETPSNVFGISTPGQAINQQINQNNDANVPNPENQSYSSSTRGRRGGHTFVMDDGDAQGNSRMMRFRSSSGHMIMMNDTKDFIYIINSKGTSWIEMSSQGDVNVYSGSKCNIFAQSGLNLDSKGPVKIHGSTIDIKSDGALNLEGKDVNLKAGGTLKLGGDGGLHLKSKKNTYLTGMECLQIKSGGHIDIKGSCTTVQSGDASPAMDASGAMEPMQMPTKEPWTGHKAAAGGGVPNPTAQPSYGAANGQPDGAAGNYGATNNFGSGQTQQDYGNLPSDVGPITYNAGQQGSFDGQSSATAQSAQRDANITDTTGVTGGNYGSTGTALRDSAIPDSTGTTGGNSGGDIATSTGAQVIRSAPGTNALAGITTSVIKSMAATAINNLINGNTTSTQRYPNTQSYTTVSKLQNITYGTGASFDQTTSSQINPAEAAQYSVGELQNNPANLQYSSTDKFAIGYANNLSVYLKPEDGIAAMMQLFDSYYTNKQLTSAQLLAAYLQANLQDNVVKDAARFTENFIGIRNGSYVNLKDAATRIAWASAMISYIQKRIIYTYDQVAAGCAKSLDINVAVFKAQATPKQQPWTNSGAQFGFGASGYVPPYGNNAKQGKSSLLDVAANAALNTVVNRLTGTVSNYVNNTVNNLFNTGGTNYSTSNYNSGIAASGGTTGTGNTGGVGLENVPTGVSYGSGQCTALVQAANPNLGSAGGWYPGQSVVSGTLPPGTCIAVGFNRNDGGYGTPDAPYGKSGQTHAAILLDYQKDANGNVTGIVVQDQWVGKDGVPQPAGIRTLSVNQDYGRPPGAQNVANYYAIRKAGDDPNTIYSAGKTVQKQPDNPPLPPERPQDLGDAKKDAADQEKNDAASNADARDLGAQGATPVNASGSKADSLDTPQDIQARLDAQAAAASDAGNGFPPIPNSSGGQALPTPIAVDTNYNPPVNNNFRSSSSSSQVIVNGKVVASSNSRDNDYGKSGNSYSSTKVTVDKDGNVVTEVKNSPNDPGTRTESKLNSGDNAANAAPPAAQNNIDSKNSQIDAGNKNINNAQQSNDFLNQENARAQKGIDANQAGIEKNNQLYEQGQISAEQRDAANANYQSNINEYKGNIDNNNARIEQNNQVINQNVQQNAQQQENRSQEAQAADNGGDQVSEQSNFSGGQRDSNNVDASGNAGSSYNSGGGGGNYSSSSSSSSSSGPGGNQVSASASGPGASASASATGPDGQTKTATAGDGSVNDSSGGTGNSGGDNAVSGSQPQPGQGSAVSGGGQQTPQGAMMTGGKPSC
jgi:hypothetical protein